MSDVFKYFASPISDALTVEIPAQVTNAQQVTKILRIATGLSFPSDTDTFWVNSRRCILKRRLDGSPLGELIEVIK